MVASIYIAKGINKYHNKRRSETMNYKKKTKKQKENQEKYPVIYVYEQGACARFEIELVTLEKCPNNFSKYIL